MIPLHKLSGLPRPQMLRKAAKIIGAAENRLAVSGSTGIGEEYLAGVMRFLAAGGGFAGAGAEALESALRGFTAACQAGDPLETRRALNTVYHLLLAETGRSPADWDFIEATGALDPSQRRPFQGMQVYLEDIRSPFNVGAMFRAAESFGAEKIWLSPLSADPRHKRAERTAMGCVGIVPWERVPRDPFAGPDGSAVPGFPQGSFFALETGGTPLGDFKFPPRGLMIAGSEELGVSPRALAAADASLGRVSIPVYGAKGSLNVSVASGIVMQAWAAALARLR